MFAILGLTSVCTKITNCFFLEMNNWKSPLCSHSNKNSNNIELRFRGHFG